MTVPLGIRPQFLAVDSRTHTIYVANVGSNTISVVDGRRCNARTTAGCRPPAVDIPVGPEPFTLALNEATDSLYVTMLGAPTVAILDLRDCKATELRGCLRPPVELDVGEAPGGIAINRRTEHDLRHGPGLERRVGDRRRALQRARDAAAATSGRCASAPGWARAGSR